MMTFLYVAPRYHTNQIWAFRALRAAGHHVHLAVLYRGKSEDYAEVVPEVVPLSPLGRWLVRRASRRTDEMNAYRTVGVVQFLALWRLVRRVRPDAVVVRGPSMPISVAALLIARLSGIRIIIYTQGNMVLRPAWKERAKALTLGLLHAAWMTTNKSERDDALGPHSRMYYVPFVAPDHGSVPSPREERHQPVRILMVGKYEPRKHHILLIDALADRLKSGEMHLTLIGEVSTPAHESMLAEVKQRIGEVGVTGAVDVKLNLPYTAMGDEYAKADLYVLPSSNEPAAVSHVEAMSHGLPVIVSTSCGTKCYVHPGKNGEIFKAGDVNDLRAAIDRSIADDLTYARLSMGACESIREHHSGDAYVRSMGLMLRSLGRELKQS